MLSYINKRGRLLDHGPSALDPLFWIVEPGYPDPYFDTVFPGGRPGQDPNGASAGRSWVGMSARAFVKATPSNTFCNEDGASAWMFCEMKQPNSAGLVSDLLLNTPPEISPISIPLNVFTPLVLPPTAHV